MISALLVIFIISFLVIIHELGHFIAAKLNKIKVEEFGFGYPPKLLTLFQFKNTEFTLNWLPFGGFVKIEGEDGPDKSKLSQKTNKGKEQPFYKKSTLIKVIVLAAGAGVNFLFGILVFSVVSFHEGIPEPLMDKDARIGQVMHGSPADEAGVPENVNIIGIKINTQEYQIHNFEQVISLLKDHRGETVTLKTTGQCKEFECLPQYQEYEVYIRKNDETPANEGAMGIVFKQFVFVRYPPLQMIYKSVINSFQQAIMFSQEILKAFVQIFIDIFRKRELSEQVAGPIGIVHIATKQDFAALPIVDKLMFSALLSINLGIMNLLPIPALDGGRAVFVIMQRFFKRKELETIEAYTNYLGFAVLVGLLILISGRDIWRIFQG